jgi:hypothetical protein
MYANMAIPATGIRIEKIIAGIPNTEAAAGEVKADSILSNVALLYLHLHRFNHIFLGFAFKPRKLAYHDYGLQATFSVGFRVSGLQT